MLIVTGYVQVPPSDLKAFTRDLADLAEATRERDGVLSYDAAVVDPSRGRLSVPDEPHRACIRESGHFAAPEAARLPASRMSRPAGWPPASASNRPLARPMSLGST